MVSSWEYLSFWQEKGNMICQQSVGVHDKPYRRNYNDHRHPFREQSTLQSWNSALVFHLFAYYSSISLSRSVFDLCVNLLESADADCMFISFSGFIIDHYLFLRLHTSHVYFDRIREMRVRAKPRPRSIRPLAAVVWLKTRYFCQRFFLSVIFI